MRGRKPGDAERVARRRRQRILDALRETEDGWLKRRELMEAANAVPSTVSQDFGVLKGLVRWEPPKGPGQETGWYVHVLREVETLLARQAWAEGIVKTLDPRDRQLPEEEYEAYRQASRWRRELPSGPELMERLGRVPIKRSKPRWMRDESLRKRYQKLVDLGLDPEEAEAAVRSIGVVGGKGVSSEVAEAVLRLFGVERSPLVEAPQRESRAQDRSSEATWP